MASSQVARTSLIDVVEVALLSTDAAVHLLWEMLEQKARHMNIDPAGFFERFDVRVPRYRERWADEMGEHLARDLPHFDAMRLDLRRRLRARR